MLCLLQHYKFRAFRKESDGVYTHGRGCTCFLHIPRSKGFYFNKKMDLENILENIKYIDGKGGIVIRYSFVLKKWLCHYNTSKHNIQRKIRNGVIGVGEKPMEALSNLVKNSK